MAASCVQCRARYRSEARFCGSCGARQPEPVENPDAVARFRTVLEKFAEAGGLSERELQQLETLRQRLGLSVTTHERLLAEFETRAQSAVTLSLSVDVSTIRHFEVGSRCMLRFSVENHGDLALEKLDIHSCSHAGHSLEPVSTPTLFPGHPHVIPLWLVPEVAGFHELRGVLHAVDLLGERAFYAFDAVQFRVGATGAGPSVSVVHIDQGSARVIDNSRTNFAAPTPDAGGLVADGQWHPVPVRALSPARAAHLVPALVRFAPSVRSSEQAPEPAPEPASRGPFSTTSNSAALRASDTASQRTPSNAVPDADGADAAGPVDFTIETDEASYHLTSTIALGDLATLYGGRRRVDGALVVAKVVDDPQDNDLVQSEIRAIDLLRAEDSPQLKHIPVVLDRFRTPDGRLGTVFEHLDGYDLFTIRDKLPDGVPARHIVWILRRCLSALGWAHSHGILHGNLDPSHIVVRPHDHNVWLIDWCYSIVNPARTGQRFRCLNEDYSPPEVGARKPPLPSSDLYSLGKCMIFAMGGDPSAKALPEGIDDRLVRFLQFFVRESALGRAQDAWEMYTQLDRLRKDIYGRHKFIKFEI